MFFPRSAKQRSNKQLWFSKVPVVARNGIHIRLTGIMQFTAQMYIIQFSFFLVVQGGCVSWYQCSYCSNSAAWSFSDYILFVHKICFVKNRDELIVICLTFNVSFTHVFIILLQGFLQIIIWLKLNKGFTGWTSIRCEGEMDAFTVPYNIYTLTESKKNHFN